VLALSQGPEPEQSHGLPRRGCTDGHLYFIFLLRGAYQGHCQDNNISVNCADGDFLVSSVGCMQHYAWLQGAKAEVSRSGGFLKPSSPSVMTSSLSASWNESWRTPQRKLNYSVLFSLTMRKLAQFHYSSLVFSSAFPTWLLLYPSMSPYCSGLARGPVTWRDEVLRIYLGHKQLVEAFLL